MAKLRHLHVHRHGAFLCALVLGCVTPPEPEPPPREPVVSAVPDGDWELVTSTFIGTGRIPGVPRATLAFQCGTMSAFSGCNRASAAVRLVDDWLEVGVMAATRRGCAEPERIAGRVGADGGADTLYNARQGSCLALSG